MFELAVAGCSVADGCVVAVPNVNPPVPNKNPEVVFVPKPAAVVLGVTVDDEAEKLKSEDGCIADVAAVPVLTVKKPGLE